MKKLTTLIPRQILILILLASILNIARVFIFQTEYTLYLFWNIFLALLPFAVSSFLLAYHRKGKLATPLFIIGGIVWVLLLPNAPYIITDMIHVGHNRSTLALYDTFLFFSFAWAGILLAFYSISHIEEILENRYAKRTVSILIPLIMLLASFGMYLGRFLRFNTWDILSSHMTVLGNAWSIISQPANYAEAYVFTGTAFIFLSLSYWAWKSGVRTEPKVDNTI
jgi:uncharacterized membrane protein